MRNNLLVKLLLLLYFLPIVSFSQNGVGVNTSTPKSSFEDNGSFGKVVSIITGSTTLDDTHSSIVCNNGSSAITVTLPPASTCAGRIYEIKRNTSSTAIVTISGTIDGVSNYVLNYANQSICVFSDGTNWHSRDGSGDNSNWKLTGNSGTVAGTNFIGTTDAVDWTIKTNNSERMRVKSAGNVGIGNTNPNQLLHVSGNFQLGDSMANTGTGNRLYFSNNYNNSDPVSIYRINSGFDVTTLRFEVGDNDNTLVNAGGGDFIDFCSNSTTANPMLRMVTTTSNVGISAPTPTSRLHVIASNAQTANYAGTFLSNIATSSTANITKKGLEVTSTGTWNGATSTNIGIHVSSVTGGTNNYDAIFNGTGVVGIGTSSPQQSLSVQNGLNIDQAGSNSGTITNSLTFGSNSGEGIASKRNATGNQYGLDFYTSSMNRMSITNAGNVGLGCTAPQFKLHVIGDIASSATVRSTNTVVTGAITACSDFRYKKDISPLRDALSNLMKLKGVTYQWRTDEFPDKKFSRNQQVGFIAQEIEKVYPQVVLTDTDGYKAVDYSKLTPLLVEALKEQQKEIEALKEENRAIKWVNEMTNKRLDVIERLMDGTQEGLSTRK